VRNRNKKLMRLSLVYMACKLITGHWSLITGHWSLVTDHWSLVTGHWSLVTGHWSLIAVGFRFPPPNLLFIIARSNLDLTGNRRR